MWIAMSDKPQLEEALFRFLSTVCAGQPRSARPAVTGRDTLPALYDDPHPDLREALRHCLDAFLIELGPDPADWGVIGMPSETLGVALAALNCLAPALPRFPAQGEDEGKGRDPVAEFTAALVATLPPARERDAALSYHAVLRGLVRSSDFSRLPPERARLLHALIERSPLTALWALDAHTPASLDPLAAKLLPGWQSGDRPGGGVWRDPDDWLDVISSLLADERLARWARHRWLAMDETRPACRNVGLLLQALRDRGEQRDFVLTFYEAYDYFRAQDQLVGRGSTIRAWPVLDEIERLLRVSGDDEAAIRANRQGNEYFLKFRPLVETVIAENGIPTDYALLSREFVLALRPLLPYVTEGARQRIEFGQIEFGEESTQSEP